MILVSSVKIRVKESQGQLDQRESLVNLYLNQSPLVVWNSPGLTFGVSDTSVNLR